MAMPVPQTCGLYADTEGLGHVGDLLAFGQAAGRAGVGLDDVHRTRDENVAKTESREFALAAGDRNR